MTIDVVIVSWNVREELHRCLTSVMGALRPGDQVVVVDNASSDGSPDMVREAFSQVRLIVNAANFGYSAAANQGIRVCVGEAVLILNPDTVIPPFALQRAEAALGASTKVGALGFRTVNPDGTPQSFGRETPTAWSAVAHWLLPPAIRRRSLEHRMIRAHGDSPDLVEVPSLSGAAMVVRASTFTRIGLFDESLPAFGEDVDFVQRVRAAGMCLAVVGDAPVIHQGGASFRQIPAAYVLAMTGLYEFCIKYDRRHALVRNGLRLAGTLRWMQWSMRGWLSRRGRAEARLWRRASMEVIRWPTRDRV